MKTSAPFHVSFVCSNVVLFEGVLAMVPEAGDSVELAGVKGHVSDVRITYTQGQGMSIVANVRKLK